MKRWTGAIMTYGLLPSWETACPPIPDAQQKQK
jgi:hypothetical protein